MLWVLHIWIDLLSTQLPKEYATAKKKMKQISQSQITAGLKTCSISVCPSIRGTQNGGIQMCSVSLLQQMSTGVKSHDLPHQAIRPTLSTQHLCSRFISKNHHTWGFHHLIPHTQINQLAVTAKVLSQPAIQLCVPSVAVQSRQTDCHGLHERLPWLFNIYVSSEHRSYLWFARD